MAFFSDEVLISKTDTDHKPFILYHKEQLKFPRFPGIVHLLILNLSLKYCAILKKSPHYKLLNQIVFLIFYQYPNLPMHMKRET